MKELYKHAEADDSASVNQVESVEQVKDIWLALENECDGGFFQSWYWTSIWLDMALTKVPVYFFVYQRAGILNACCLVTFCPARRRKNLVRTLQLQINEYLCQGCNMVKAYNGLLTRKGEEKRSWEMFFQVVDRFNSQWDEILLSSLLPEDYALISSIDHGLGMDLDKTTCVWVKDFNLPATTRAALLDSCKKKSKQQLKQSLKAFAGCGPLEISAASDTESALEYFAQMETIHTQRWQAVGKGGSFANPLWVDFHKRMINKYFDVGLILLFKVTCGDMILGYLYGHYYRNRVYMQQTGFTLMNNNTLRPGYVSHFEAMLFCAERGAVSYDLLPDGAVSYKKFFTSPGPTMYQVLLKRPRTFFVLEKLIEHVKKWIRRDNAHKDVQHTKK